MRILPLLLVLAACSAPRPIEERDRLSLHHEVEATISNFKEADPSLNAWFDQKGYGYAIFPQVTKGGVGVGGAWGRGEVFEQGRRVGYATVGQGTVGLQLGAQAYSELIFFKDQRALDEFKRGNYEFSAQASAIAVDKGASATADYEGGVAVFTLGIGGLMFEASVGGQKFDFEPTVH